MLDPSFDTVQFILMFCLHIFNLKKKVCFRAALKIKATIWNCSPFKNYSVVGLI